MNTQKMYCLYDKVSRRYAYPALCNTDGEYVRAILQTVSTVPSEYQLVSFPLSLPVHNDKKQEIKFPKSFSMVSMESYKLPESAMEAFKPLNLSEEELNDAIQAQKKMLDKKNKSSDNESQE